MNKMLMYDKYDETYRKVIDVEELRKSIQTKIDILEKLQKEMPNNEEIRIKIIVYKEFLKDLEVEDD